MKIQNHADYLHALSALEAARARARVESGAVERYGTLMKMHQRHARDAEVDVALLERAVAEYMTERGEALEHQGKDLQ